MLNGSPVAPRCNNQLFNFCARACVCVCVFDLACLCFVEYRYVQAPTITQALMHRTQVRAMVASFHALTTHSLRAPVRQSPSMLRRCYLFSCTVRVQADVYCQYCQSHSVYCQLCDSSKRSVSART